MAFDGNLGNMAREIITDCEEVPMHRLLPRLKGRPQPSSPPQSRPPDWHRTEVGGMWDEVGPLERDFLVSQGLQPQHDLLDVGCGSLRGGVRFIEYLQPGHYVGIDMSQELLDAGRTIELPRYGLTDKEPTLVQMEDFSFPTIGRQFDYALAASVFTHLPLNDIILCLVNMGQVLKDEGTFFATFFPNERGRRHLGSLQHMRPDGEPFQTHFARDPFHYELDDFRWACSGTGLRVDYIGEWGHFRNQKMLAFTKDPDHGSGADAGSEP
jgi:SAM-dependent methyltransferase